MGTSNERWKVYSPEDLLGPLNEVEVKNAPKKLFVAGHVEFLREGPRISVVGSRRASPKGLERAAVFARFLVERGVVVVSGLAEGIDTVAHEEAIRNGGRTIAVLGTSLEKVYPKKNTALQERITRDHLAITQFPSGSPGGRWCFPARNRTMALVSDASVIVEAGETSGALSQGWEALRLARPLFIAEHVMRKAFEWPDKMLQYGAQVLFDEDLEMLLDLVPVRTAGQDITLAL